MVLLVQAEAGVRSVCSYWTILGSRRQVFGGFRRL